MVLIALCEDHSHCSQSSVLTITPLVFDVRMSHAFDDRIHYEAIKKLSDKGRTDRCDSFFPANKKLGDVMDD